MKNKTIVLAIILLIPLTILLYAFGKISFPWLTVESGKTVKRFQRIDSTLREWRWLTNYRAIRSINQGYYGNYARFPDQEELKKHLEKYPVYSLEEKDQWGNPIFYYNGREEGRCVWYASMGPDGVWFTGTKDPESIIERINDISVKNEFDFISSFASEGFNDSQKYSYLIIEDDHVVFCNMSVFLFYSTPDSLLAPIEVFEEAQRQIVEIGSYENYKSLHGDQCILHRFLESAAEHNKESIKP